MHRRAGCSASPLERGVVDAEGAWDEGTEERLMFFGATVGSTTNEGGGGGEKKTEAREILYRPWTNLARGKRNIKERAKIQVGRCKPEVPSATSCGHVAA